MAFQIPWMPGSPWQKGCRRSGSDGVDYEDIFIDPMVQPMATDQSSGQVALETIVGIKERLPGIKTICGS